MCQEVALQAAPRTFASQSHLVPHSSCGIQGLTGLRVTACCTRQFSAEKQHIAIALRMQAGILAASCSWQNYGAKKGANYLFRRELLLRPRCTAASSSLLELSSHTARPSWVMSNEERYFTPSSCDVRCRRSRARSRLQR